MSNSTSKALSVKSDAVTDMASGNVLKLKICRNKRKHESEAMQFVKKVGGIRSVNEKNASIETKMLKKPRISGIERARNNDTAVDAYSTEPQLHAIRKSQRLQNENVKSIFKKITPEKILVLVKPKPDCKKTLFSTKHTDLDVIPVTMKPKPNCDNISVTKKPKIDCKIPVSTKSNQGSEKIPTNTWKSKLDCEKISVSKKPKTDCEILVTPKPKIYCEKISFTTNLKRHSEKVELLSSNEQTATINESSKRKTVSATSISCTEPKEKYLATDHATPKLVGAPKFNHSSNPKNNVNAKPKLSYSLTTESDTGTPNTTRYSICKPDTQHSYNLTQNAYKIGQNNGKNNILNNLLRSSNDDKPIGARSGLSIIGSKPTRARPGLTIIGSKPNEDSDIIFLNDVRPTKVMSELAPILNQHTTINAIKPSTKVSTPAITDSSKLTFNITKPTSITSNCTPNLGESTTVTSNSAISKSTSHTSKLTPNFSERTTVHFNFTTNDGKPTIITSNCTPNLGESIFTSKVTSNSAFSKATMPTSKLTQNLTAPDTVNGNFTTNNGKPTIITSNCTPNLGESTTITSKDALNGAISKTNMHISKLNPNFSERTTVNCNFTTNDGKPTIITSNFPINFCKLTPNLDKTKDTATPKGGKSTTITRLITTNGHKPTLNVGNLVSISQVDLSKRAANVNKSNKPSTVWAEKKPLSRKVQPPLSGASFPTSLVIQEASPSNNNNFHQRSTFANVFSQNVSSSTSSHEDYLVLGRNCIMKLAALNSQSIKGDIRQPTPVKLVQVSSFQDQSCGNELITGDICPNESLLEPSVKEAAVRIKIEPGLIDDNQSDIPLKPTEKSFPVNESGTFGTNDCAFRIKTEPGVEPNNELAVTQNLNATIFTKTEPGIEPSSTNNELAVTQTLSGTMFIKTERESNQNQPSISTVTSVKSLAGNEDNASLFRDSNLRKAYANSMNEPNVTRSLSHSTQIQSEPSNTKRVCSLPPNVWNLISIKNPNKPTNIEREELIESFAVSKKNPTVGVMRSSSKSPPAIDGSSEIITKPIVSLKKIHYPNTEAPNQVITTVPSVLRTSNTSLTITSVPDLSYQSQVLLDLNQAAISLEKRTMPVLQMESETISTELAEIMQQNLYDLWDPRYCAEQPPTLSPEDNVRLQPGIPDNFAKPLRLGFVREIRLRRIITSKQRMDIYYFAPVAYRKSGRSKFRSSVEVKEHLEKLNITELSSKDFSFRGVIISSPPWEFVRLANKACNGTKTTKQATIGKVK